MKPNHVIAGLSRQLQDDGYAFIPQWHSNRSTREVASFVGTIIDLDALLPGSGIPSVQTLQPRTEHEAPASRYSGVFGLNEFPLHPTLLTGLCRPDTSCFDVYRVPTMWPRDCFPRLLS